MISKDLWFNYNLPNFCDFFFDLINSKHLKMIYDFDLQIIKKMIWQIWQQSNLSLLRLGYKSSLPLPATVSLWTKSSGNSLVLVKQFDTLGVTNVLPNLCHLFFYLNNLKNLKIIYDFDLKIMKKNDLTKSGNKQHFTATTRL